MVDYVIRSMAQPHAIAMSHARKTVAPFPLARVAVHEGIAPPHVLLGNSRVYNVCRHCEFPQPSKDGGGAPRRTCTWADPVSNVPTKLLCAVVKRFFKSLRYSTIACMPADLASSKRRLPSRWLVNGVTFQP